MEEQQYVPSKPRRRSANFTTEEQAVLSTILARYRPIIECKKTDCVTWKEKEDAWKAITNEFNLESPAKVLRSQESLKKCFENRKRVVRKAAAANKGTKGGQEISIVDQFFGITMPVKSENTVYGFLNKYDCDDAEAGTVQTENTNGVLQLHSNEQNPNINNWCDYKPQYWQTPSSNTLANIRKLEPEVTLIYSEDSEPSTSASTSKDTAKQSRRKRDELSAIKLELAQFELESLKRKRQREEEEAVLKRQREEEEFELRKESIKLDIKIKRAQLKKMSNDCYELE